MWISGMIPISDKEMGILAVLSNLFLKSVGCGKELRISMKSLVLIGMFGSVWPLLSITITKCPLTSVIYTPSVSHSFIQFIRYAIWLTAVPEYSWTGLIACVVTVQALLAHNSWRNSVHYQIHQIHYPWSLNFRLRTHRALHAFSLHSLTLNTFVYALTVAKKYVPRKIRRHR